MNLTSSPVSHEIRKGSKKNAKCNFFFIGVNPPPPQNVNFFTKMSNKKFSVPKLNLLHSELTKTHFCVKKINFEASFHCV